jgi:hypothetical protein
MFPNVRLMVVAILAAIVGIGCGLGLFATFRVNHEPLARLAEGSPPLQLAFDNLAIGSNARAPSEARLPVNSAPKLVSVPIIVAAASPTVDQAEAAPANAGDSESLQQPAAAAVEDNGTASVAIAVATEQPSATADGAAAPSQQEAVATPQDEAPTAAAATASSTEQTADIGAAAKDPEPAAAKPTKAATSKAAKPAARASRVAAQARRATKPLRARRTLAAAPAQPAYQYSQPTYSQPTDSQQTYSQPTYTWADGTSQPSQLVRRVQIKRHRAAKKAPPAAQANPAAATAGLTGIP